MFCEFAECHMIVISQNIVVRLSSNRLWIWVKASTTVVQCVCIGDAIACCYCRWSILYSFFFLLRFKPKFAWLELICKFQKWAKTAKLVCTLHKAVLCGCVLRCFVVVSRRKYLRTSSFQCLRSVALFGTCDWWWTPCQDITGVSVLSHLLRRMVPLRLSSR